MTKTNRKFYYFLGLACFFIIVTLIQSQFNSLNTEIETTHTNSIPTHISDNLHIGVVITPQMARIIQCESGFNQYKLGDKGRAIGLAQFHEDTFLMFQKQSGIKGNIFDAYTQLKVMAWALDNKKEYHWTCK